MLISSITLGILKEIIVFLFLLSLVPLIKKNKYITDSSILGKLKILFLCGLSLFLIFIFLGFMFPRGESDYLKGIVDNPPLNFILTGFVSLLIGAICIVIIVMLYELIIFHRKRVTILNFKILILLSIAYIIWTNFKGFSSGQIPEDILTGEPRNVLGALAYISIFLNSFKSSWVTFLNRKQKYTVLICSALVMVFLGIGLNFPTKNIAPYFSLSVGTLQILTWYFFLLYTVFSFINILLHLPSAGIFDKKVKQLSSLHQLSSSVASVLEIDKLLKEIVNHTYNITNSDSIWLLIQKDKNSTFTIGASKNLLPEDKSLVNLDPEGFLNRTIISSKSSLILNELKKELFISGISKGSLIGIPLISSKLGTIGILYAKKNNNYGYSEDEDYILNAFANHAVVAIENALYFQDSLDKKELEKELAVAKRIQETLLPKKVPVLYAVEVAALNLPCKEVGGDYYDLIKISEEKLGVAIADVSGKGIPASLLMSNLQACLRTLSKENLTIKEIVTRINNIIYENTDEYQYITFFYGEIDTKKNKITFCNAGHNPPILLRKDDSEILLKEGGIVIGWMQNVTYKQGEIEIKSGDQIIFYTDGVTEAMNSEEETFEEWRLRKIIKENAKNPPKIIIDEIIKEIKVHIAGSYQIDDLTLIVIKVQ